MKVVTRTYPLSCCYIRFARSNISRGQKHLFKMAKNTSSKRPHFQGVLDKFFPKRSKGESLKHYKLSFQHNELALADINKVCILHVKRVIEPQRPLNTNNEPAPIWLSIFMRNLLNCKFLTVITRWLIYVANLSNINKNKHHVRSERP